MAITLVEVYEVLAATVRDAQEAEARTKALTQQVQTLEAEVAQLRTLARTLAAEHAQCASAHDDSTREIA